MNAAKNLSAAELLDQFMQALAIALFLFALKFAISAGMHFADSTFLTLLDWAELGVALLAIAILLPAAFHYRRLKSRLGQRFLESDGYVADIFKKSFAKSFSITFLFLVLLEIVTKNQFLDLPARFFVQVILTMMLGTFGLTFFILSRSPEKDFPEEAGNVGE